MLSVEFSAGSVLATATLNASVSSAKLAACRTSLEAGNFTTTVRGTPWAARAFETGEGPGSQKVGHNCVALGRAGAAASTEYY